MIDHNEIEVEIKRLEQAETNYQNCTRLAVLYCIRDHQKPQKASKLDSYSYGQSEFLMAVSEADINEALQVLDEHMEAIKLLYPKEYSMLITKIKKGAS